jgi:hypothetical protein
MVADRQSRSSYSADPCRLEAVVSGGLEELGHRLLRRANLMADVPSCQYSY